MSKTNFKCMYLIDDIMYKEAFSNNQKNNQNLSSAPLDQRQAPPKTKDYFIQENLTGEKKINLQGVNNSKGNELQPTAMLNGTDLHLKSTNDNNEDCECMDTQEMNGENNRMADMVRQSPSDHNDQTLRQKGLKRKSSLSSQQQEISSRSNQSDTGQNSEKSDNLKTDDDYYHRGEKRKRAKEIHDNVLSESPPINSRKSKRRRTKSYLNSELNSETDDEKEWEELRKRYYKLRYDYSDDDGSPQNVTKPVQGERKKRENPKNLLLRKQNPSNSRNNNVFFYCTICDTRFKKFSSLSRHMKNMHDEYFEERNRQNKRKQEDEDRTNKRFKGGVNLKRKATTTKNDTKRARKEFPCMFCQRYFKTVTGLKRHTENQHGSDANREKRKNTERDEGRYLKRQKTKSKASVTYQNYF